jgi:hypothetical protein
MILGDSFPANQTYQVMVSMQHRRNITPPATGFVLIHVQDTSTPLIFIGCVISTLCVAQLEYQRINPTTQVALFSVCSGNCHTLLNITWKVYQGSRNGSSSVTHWTDTHLVSLYPNRWFFGKFSYQ